MNMRDYAEGTGGYVRTNWPKRYDRSGPHARAPSEFVCVDMKKPRAKANGNGSPTVNDRQIVQALRAKGLSGDVISEVLNVNKNTLRARHALPLHIGRAKLKQQKAAARDLTFAEMCCADAILTAINSEWQTPDGNLIWSGLDGDGAKSAADAFAAWLRGGGRFITTGIGKNFSPERIAEFVALKREAQALPVLED